MAAYASLISLMRVIHDLEHHPSPPISLDKHLVESITQRITYFQEFLHSYCSSGPVADNDEEVADPLEMRIAGAAFAAEDAIEYHIVDCINHKKKKKKANDDEKAKSLNRCYGILQSVIEEMDSIKKVVIDTQKIKKVPMVHDQVSKTNVAASVAARSETLVGSDASVLEIMEKLIEGKTFQVIPIVGMGGIGKTFLAKTIYTKPLIKEHFDICAWATISQHYDPGEILRELLSQATKINKEQMSGKSVDQLGLELHQYLFYRRFLIVMDDMWSIESWNNIQHYFPDNYNGSRVLVTTRLSKLLTTDYSFSMKFLDKASSWDLFSKTVFGEKSSCPPELEEIGEKIVDNCRGLPLSISVVGGLLKNMDGTRASWESIQDNFTSVVNMRNHKHCLRLLKLSYNHLPVYLKPCFLYMGVFKEDEEICVSTLVLQWVSEGFLKPTEGEALEITGRGFLEDLVGRNLILIHELGSTGSIKYCKIHDLVRDMCLKEGQKEGFYHVMGKCNHPSPQGMNTQRRIIIPDNTLKEYNVRGDLRFMSHTRSIICEYGRVPLVHDRNVTTSETFVGSDGVLIEIMEKLDGGQLDFQVIAIVGTGGIGKTFLAKTIYTKPLIKERFDICAWVTISQNYDTREILCELLFQATNTNKEQQSGKSVDELGLELCKYLFGRRFLIVMDDMWSIDSWDQIQHFFPDKSNGSRVLVTTRLSQLSLKLTNDYSFRMNFLDKASSWDLFSKTVFGENSSCPPELEEIGEKIVNNCRGLPLSISVVGGLLKTMDGTRASWESIRENFTSAVNMTNDKHCLTLLKLSYNHLPVYLKPCFLYMGVFEEDEEICVSTLVLQWVSEGFLKPTKGEALEITGRGFLQELVGRNLVLIDKLGSTGSIKSCKIHDLVRDMCLKEYNIRGDLRFMSHTRSIIYKYSRFPLCKNLVLLRTLQVDNRFAHDDVDLNSVVSRYVNLRHLDIPASWKPPFLPSISHLWNLRTLVVSFSFNFEPPLVVDFWEMTQLRHMNFIIVSACLPDPPNCDGKNGVAVVIMENLHTLKGILNFKFREGVVKRIPNIKKLCLHYDVDSDDDDDVYFLGNMKYLCGLESLSVKCEAPYPHCPRSRLFTLLQKITYPHSLKKLCLRVPIKLEWNDMLEKIGLLPLLEKLRLTYGHFKKGKWEIGQGQFPCLKYLKVSNCWGLENWSAVEEESSILPRLEHLHLNMLKQLKKIPFELGNIDTLKSINIDRCGEGAVKSAKEMLDEQVELQGGEDQLSFHVQVWVEEEQQHLMCLADSNLILCQRVVNG